MTHPLIRNASGFALLGAAPMAAWAHVGEHADGHVQAHAHGLVDAFAQAFIHPFTGADHLAAMFAVGVWSALTVRPAWRAPAAFVVLLMLGALAGFAGLHVPAVEPMIAASVLVLGLLVAVQKRMPWGVAAVVAGVFAFFHGAAHGAELASDSVIASLAALAGMALGSALLHVSGMGVGHLLSQKHYRWIAKLGGAATALLGLGMLARLA